MKTGKLVRMAGIGAAMLVALGAIGYAFGGGSDRSVRSVAPGDPYAGYSPGEGDVMASIDSALGRPSSVEPQPPVANAGVPAQLSESAKVAQGRSADSSGGASVTAPNSAVRDGGATGGGGAGAPGVVQDRKIVQTASLRLQVKEVGGSFEEVGRIASSAGGFIASSNFSLQGEQQVASLTIRVPATRYQDVLSQVRALGAKVDNEASNASDVTEEYSDLTARQRNLEATESQLLELLGRANSINEILQVQDRLNGVRSEIERVKGRMVLLDKLTDLATLTVHLRPVVAAGSGGSGGTDLGARVREAWEDSLEFLTGIVGGVLTVVVFAWWVPLLVVPAWLVGRRWLASKPAAGPQPVEGV